MMSKAKSRTTYYQWEWFRRDQWVATYPTLADNERALLNAFGRILGAAGVRVLDCACGFGERAAYLADMGFEAWGWDACSLAAEQASELASARDHKVRYFASPWDALAERGGEPFQGIFYRDLCHTGSEEELSACIEGLKPALAPGAPLVFPGTAQDDPPGEGLRQQAKAYEGHHRVELAWTHARGSANCTHLVFHELGKSYVDRYHAYLVQERGDTRLETAVMRERAAWDWPILEWLFVKAGFHELKTEVFPPPEGSTLPVRINVARV
jgi:SAM-dependent methyltransferase